MLIDRRSDAVFRYLVGTLASQSDRYAQSNGKAWSRLKQIPCQISRLSAPRRLAPSRRKDVTLPDGPACRAGKARDRLAASPPVSLTAGRWFPGRGLNGNAVQSRGCPRNCTRRVLRHHATGFPWEGDAGPRPASQETCHQQASTHSRRAGPPGEPGSACLRLFAETHAD
jgi:hypothetical protein